jgi:hypothetical protein
LLLDPLAKRKFNAGIYFTPACCSPKSRQKDEGNRIGFSEMHTRQIAVFNALPQRALIFTFADDPYVTKRDFAKLIHKHKKTIKLYQFNCGMGHSSAYQGCKYKTMDTIIRQYIQKNIKRTAKR